MEASELWERVAQNVEWVEVRAQQLAAAETDRTRALDVKANQVLAVSAVATSIAGSVLAPRLDQAPLAAGVLAVVAGVFVLVAAGSSVAALLPRSFSSFSTPELNQWPTGDFLTQAPRNVHGRVLNGWLAMIARARHLNDLKAQLVRVALLSLLGALLFTTAAAGIISA